MSGPLDHTEDNTPPITGTEQAVEEMPTTPAAADPRLTQEFAAADSRSTELEDAALAKALARRGLGQEEIAQILASGRTAQPVATHPLAAAVPPSTRPDTVDAELQADDLRPAITEISGTERAEADRLLTSANIARRKGDFKQASSAVLRAIEIAPADAAALELYGDILQATGQVDAALAAYKRAVEADSKRTSAERKFAELTLMQNRDIERLRLEYIPRSPIVAVMLSSILPGAGQLYNGQILKGVLHVLIALALIVALFFSPYGLAQQTKGVSTSLISIIVALAIMYAISAFDARSGARPRGGVSGWDV